MKVARMRLVDRWLGGPVCFLLTCFRKVFGRRPPAAPRQPRSILFVKLAEQGSTVLAQSALRAAVERVGCRNVYFLLFAENRPILDLLNLVPPENVIAIDARGLFGAVFGALRALFRLRRLGVEAAIDMEFFARASAALCYLSGARWRVGFHSFGNEAANRGDLMTHRLSFNPYLHTSQTFRLLVDALDQPAASLPTFPRTLAAPEPAPATFAPGPDELAEVRRLVRMAFSEGKNATPQGAEHRLILLNGNASDLVPLRRWADDRYVELAQRLLQKYPDACVVFTGAPSEAESAAALTRQVASPRCASLAGKTTLRQLLVLYCLAEILVTNDSGPAHFATLTPIDVVVLFGPETPKLFAAVSPRTHPLWAGLACSPCVNAFNDRHSPCRDNVCMQHITVRQVFDAVCRVYETRGLAANRPAA